MEGGKFYATILSVSEYSRTDTLWVYVSIVVVKDLTSEMRLILSQIRSVFCQYCQTAIFQYSGLNN